MDLNKFHRRGAEALRLEIVYIPFKTILQNRDIKINQESKLFNGQHQTGNNLSFINGFKKTWTHYLNVQ